jgi:hypothetical protein
MEDDTVAETKLMQAGLLWGKSVGKKDNSEDLGIDVRKI